MKKYIFIILILISAGLIFYIYKLSTYTYINAKFPELRPMEENIPIYYKGIIIGRAKERKHSSDLHHTIIRLLLYPKNLLLPENTTVLLKKEKKNKKERDFLELIYPKNPSKVMLTNNSTITGEATVDIDTFMANQKVDELEEIKENLAQSARNLNFALEQLGYVFENVNEILKQNQNNLYQTTGNIRKISKSIDDSIDEKKINDTLNVVNSSIQNIEDLTNSLNSDTPKTLDNIEGITSNVNAITCGVRKTLRKKFGTLRLIFGQVIDECD